MTTDPIGSASDGVTLTNICTKYYCNHHEIGSMNHCTLFMIRSWIITLVRHKKSGSTPKCMAGNKNAWFEINMAGPTQKCSASRRQLTFSLSNTPASLMKLIFQHFVLRNLYINQQQISTIRPVLQEPWRRGSHNALNKNFRNLG